MTNLMADTTGPYTWAKFCALPKEKANKMVQLARWAGWERDPDLAWDKLVAYNWQLNAAVARIYWVRT